MLSNYQSILATPKFRYTLTCQNWVHVLLCPYHCFVSLIYLLSCTDENAVLALHALSYHGIELQVNVLYSCLCCKFQEWLSYEYNGDHFSSTPTWKKSSAMLFNCVYSSARQLSKPYCKHCLRFIQITVIMKLMLFTLGFKWQLLFLWFYIYLYWSTVKGITLGWPFSFTEWWVVL